MRFRVAIFNFVITAVLVVGACSTSEPKISWEGTVDTLPDGSVRVVSPPVGLWEAGLETPWRLVPEFTLGSLEGDRPDVFSTISGLAVDADGRILVVDRNTNEVRIFSAEGEHLHTVGRTGEGPGEYTQINGLVRLPSDSLLVIDQQGNRYSILAPEGEYERSVRRQLPFHGWLFDGGIDGERAYELFAVFSETDQVPALVGTHLRDSEAALDTILVPELPGPTYEAFHVRTEQFGSYLGVPFSPRHVYRLDGRGGLWFGRGDEFRLIHTELSGDTVREVVLNTPAVPVTDADIADWMEEEYVRSFQERGGKIDQARIPEEKPYWNDLILAPDGTLWVSRPGEPMQARFAVFDTVGRYLGEVGFDAVEPVEWLSPIVANGRLYIATQDELGVQRVQVFRIDSEIEELESAEGRDDAGA
jgi:hypothetical protein